MSGGWSAWCSAVRSVKGRCKCGHGVKVNEGALDVAACGHALTSPTTTRKAIVAHKLNTVQTNCVCDSNSQSSRGSARGARTDGLIWLGQLEPLGVLPPPAIAVVGHGCSSPAFGVGQSWACLTRSSCCCCQCNAWSTIATLDLTAHTSMR